MYLGDVILDTEMVEAYTIVRKTGEFVMGGGWQTNQPVSIATYGVVSAISTKDIQMLPEADRVHETRAFWNQQPIFTTHGDGSAIGTSDIILYKDSKYRVMSVAHYENRGYFKAIAVRMSGE